MAVTFWGWSSWVWMFSSLLVAAATWFFSRRGWLSLYKPLPLIAAGMVTGFLNGILAQATIVLAKLPPYQGTLAVYDFFVKITSNETFAALAEKMFVEIADKTISVMLAAAAVFLLHDLLVNYKKSVQAKIPTE
mgnify:CR=1 FL=1